MKLLYPEFIFLMLVPSVVLMYLIITNKDNLSKVFDNKMIEKLTIKNITKKTKLILLFVALFLMIIAMARPVIEKSKLESPKEKILFVIDMSCFEKAKKIIKTTLEPNLNIKAGIICFDNKNAYLISPFSADFLALKEALDLYRFKTETSELKYAIKGIKSLPPCEKIFLLTNKKESKTLKTDNILMIDVSSVSKIDISHQEKKQVAIYYELYPFFLIGAISLLFISYFNGFAGLIIIFFPIVLKAYVFDFELIENGKRAYKLGNYEIAKECFEKVAKRKKNKESFYNLGNVYYKLRKYKKAIYYYTLSKSKDKNFQAKVFYNIGNCYFMLERFSKACLFYQKALSLKYDKKFYKNYLIAKKKSKKKPLQKTSLQKKEITTIKRKDKKAKSAPFDLNSFYPAPLLGIE